MRILILCAVLVCGCSQKPVSEPTGIPGFREPTDAEKKKAMENAQRMIESLNEGYETSEAAPK